MEVLITSCCLLLKSVLPLFCLRCAKDTTPYQQKGSTDASLFKQAVPIIWLMSTSRTTPTHSSAAAQKGIFMIRLKLREVFERDRRRY